MLNEQGEYTLPAQLRSWRSMRRARSRAGVVRKRTRGRAGEGEGQGREQASIAKLGHEAEALPPEEAACMPSSPHSVSSTPPARAGEMQVGAWMMASSRKVEEGADEPFGELSEMGLCAANGEGELGPDTDLGLAFGLDDLSIAAEERDPLTPDEFTFESYLDRLQVHQRVPFTAQLQ